MKKFYLLFILAFLPFVANADPVEIDGIYYELYAGETNTAEVTSGSNKYSGDVVIPASVTYNEETYSVTSISGSAFYQCSGLNTVTIPNSVTSIGESAFWGCSGLTSVTIGNGVTAIGDDAFADCSGLTSVHISDIAAWCKIKINRGASNPLSIAHHLFLNDEEIVELIIPNGVTSIRARVFESCSSLLSVNIGNSVTSIGSFAFSGCSSLNTVTIGNSVTSISNNAFFACMSLTSVTFGNSVTSIGDAAFWYCSGLTSVTIPNSLTSIGNSAFRECSGLTSVTIPNSVTFIGNCAFEACSGLSSVTIPNSVTSIGEGTFASCSSLTSVTIPKNVTSIGDLTFYGCSSLIDFYCNAENVPETTPNAFSNSNIANATLHVPVGSVDAYQAAEPWKQFKQIVGLTDYDEIKITSAGQTTWCSKYDLDFTAEEGLKVYTATGYKRSTGTIWLSRIKEVPAGEGILIVGDEGVYTIPHMSTTTYYVNMLVGTLVAMTLNEADGEYTNYYLSNGKEGVGFYKVNGSVNLGANRAYLPLKKGTSGNANTRYIGFTFDDGATNIDPLSASDAQESNAAYYNLQGQRVDNPTKGLYIKNGKKIIVR